MYTFDWLYGFVVSIFLYTATSLIWPAKESLVQETVWGYDPEAYHGDLDRKDQSVSPGNEKNFGNNGGLDVLGATNESVKFDKY